MCPAYVWHNWTAYLSHKVDLHSLLDLICQSMINKYLAVSFLFARSYMLVDLHTISEEIFSLIELHGTQKKCGVNLTTTKLKYKEIRISYLKYFKISLQISNFRRILIYRQNFSVCIQNKT